MEELNYLKEAILKDMKMLPRFIKNDLTSRACFEMSKRIIGKLYMLAQDRVLTKSKIKTINDSINDDLREMFDLDPKLSILYFEYYKDLMVGYMLFSIESELWETCANIRNLHESLYGESICLDEN